MAHDFQRVKLVYPHVAVIKKLCFEFDNFTMSHRRSQGALPTFLAYLIILCFEKRRPKQKYCCSPEVKHFCPPNISGWLRHCNVRLFRLASQWYFW